MAAAPPPRSPRGHLCPALALALLLLLLLLLLPSLATAALPRLSSSPAKTAAAAAAAAADASSVTRLRGTVYRNVDAPYERDAELLPPVFPAPPADAGPVVVPCFVSRSHSTPYLEVVRHLAARGYRVVLLTDRRNVKWIRSLYGEDGRGGPFEVAVAPPELTEPTWLRLAAALEDTIESKRGARAIAQFINEFGVAQTRELFPWVRDWMKRLDPRPSVVLCDAMSEWLVDAAEAAGARVVVTNSGLFPGMADAPWSLPVTSNYPAASLERAPLWARVEGVLLEPLDSLAAMLPVARVLNAAREEVGLAPLAGPPMARLAGRLHLINSFFGFELARPLPAHIRMIGPVRSDGNSTLTGEWKEFVDGLGGERGARIVYLGFGANCILTSPRLRAVLGALKALLDEKEIDGAVWSLSMTPKEYLEQAGFFEPGAVPPQIKLTEFAPQKALLYSRAVRVFVSHGGAESCGEAMHSATPMLAAPHFADQSSNAYKLRDAGMALVVPRQRLSDAGEVADKLRRLLRDEGGRFSAGARRMRALALSKSRLAAESAADEIEYIVHYGDAHLADPGSRMSFIRRHNLDVYGAVAAAAAALLWLAWRLARGVVCAVAGGRAGAGAAGCAGGVCRLPPADPVAAKKAD